MKSEATSLLRAYAAVLFCTSPRLGAWFALATCWSPRAALAGLIALVAAALWARLFSLSPAGEPHLVNSLLCGLFIGAFHAFDAALLGWLVAAALFVTQASNWLAALLWQAGRLPLLSLPFVLACWMIELATQSSQGAVMLAAPLSGDVGTFSWSWLNGFFTALGWLLLVPYPFAGAMIFAGLLAASRYLALLAIAGYLAGQAALTLFGRHESMLIGFNFMLAAMALGGIFAIPGRLSFVVAVIGGALAGWIAIAFGSALQGLHLPLLTLPFILAVWLWLGALGNRRTLAAPTLLLDAPSAPEASYERWRLAQVRGVGCGTSDSVALIPPYFGEWQVTQGFNGRHTHRAAWQHALDFEIFDDGAKANGTGTERADYFCFGAPLLAPVAGQVIAARDDLADVTPGEPDLANNWGNHVLLRTASGAYVLLAHLRQGSLQALPGTWVAAGQAVGACGSSGRAPVPHAHLHVQSGEALGSPTLPFHLVNVLVRRASDVREFRLCHQPQEADRITAAPRNERLAQAIGLPAGLRWSYRLTDDSGSNEVRADLCSELTLLGQSRLIAKNQASVAYESTAAALGCFDRSGPSDPLLDLWVLAMGLTPLSTAADCWHDRPSLDLLPLGSVRRLLVRCLFPLSAACLSTYHRRWDDSAHAWLQEGNHRFYLLPGWLWQARTRAWIEPGRGVAKLELDAFGCKRTAVLDAIEWMDAPAESLSLARRES